VVDTKGNVIAMVFAGSKTGPNGFAVPVDLIVAGLSGELRPVGSGPCLS
jgi:acetylornithine deacetylase/succinyl-diaminopimelate desuccinylase-like protein